MKRKLQMVVLSFIIIVSIVSISFVVSLVGNITPKVNAGPFTLAECANYAAYMAGGTEDKELWYILFDLCLNEEGG